MLQDIPFEKLHASPLNPRRAMDDAAVAALAASIEQEGILQNLTVRPSPRHKGEYEIIAGATRYEAFGRLVEHGRRQRSDTLPVRVKDPCSDLELLELAMVENLQRADLHPLDEAEGYAALRRHGLLPKDIAGKVGYTERHVQLRLQLADNLTEAAKDAYRKGSFNLASARSIAAACPKSRQDGVLKRIEKGDHNYASPQRLQDTLRCEAIPLAHAIFERALYTGPVLVDTPEAAAGSDWELEEDVELAGDVEAFWSLQDAAVETRRAELAREWSDCTVVKTQHRHWSPWSAGLEEGHRSKKTGMAVIVVFPDGEVKIHTGLAPQGTRAKAETAKAKAKAAGTSAKGKSAAELAAETGENTLPTKAGQVLAKHAKTRALRAAIVAREDGPKAAMIAVIISLLGEHDVVRLGYREEHRGGDNGIEAHEVETVLARHRVKLQAFMDKGSYSISKVPGGPKRLAVKGHKAGALYRELASWNLADVTELFTALVAAGVGTWPDYDPRLGDDDVAIAMAEHLRPDVAATWSIGEGEAYFRTLRKPGLLRALDDMGIDIEAERLAGKKTAELVDSAAHVARHVQQPYLPPLFHFGTEADVRKRIMPPRSTASRSPAGDPQSGSAERAATKKTPKPAKKGSRRAAMAKKAEQEAGSGGAATGTEQGEAAE